MADRDYFQIAMDYALGVVHGDISTCDMVRRACQRQLDDLNNPEIPYFFSLERANRICYFVETLPHVKGIWARSGATIHLEGWQVFILTTVFGWVDEKGYRRFRVAYIEVPRKNAKSTLTAGVGLYLMCADDEAGAEVYSAATSREQAAIVWRTAKLMADKKPGLRRHYGIDSMAHSIHVPATASWFRALTRDSGGNLDGLNVHGGLVDELHAHKTRDVWDVLETATGSRTQPLIWGITTAGFNRAGICYEQRAYIIKILTGAVNDLRTFGIIFTIDEADDWREPKSWEKANPNWGISVSQEDIARKAQKAMEMAAAQNNFLTKHLNVWVNADVAWLDPHAWAKCADTSLTLEDFEGEKCVVALDLAAKIDLVAKAYIFQRDVDDVIHYYGFVKTYIPEDTAENSSNSQYSGWIADGWLNATEGNVTDFALVESELIDDYSRFDLQAVGYDPWQAQYLANNLVGAGLPMVELRQTVVGMSEPMKTLEALVISGRFHHDGNPCLSWMMSNVVAHLDAKENVYPRKEFPENKIDGPVALIMALGRILANDDLDKHPYNNRGLVSV